MGPEYDLALIEAGISRPGEMERLERMIHPDIGILTNIGPAHDEGFENLEEKITETLRLYARTYLFIYPSAALQDYEGTIPGEVRFSWGYQGDEDMVISSVEPTSARSEDGRVGKEWVS